MKKIWKTFLAAAVMSIAVCLCTEAAVFAETVSGEIKTDNGKGVYFTWEFDTETQTLTVEQPMKIVNYADGEAWKEYEKDIRHVILKDHAFEIWGIDYAEDITMEAGSGFSWTLDMASRTVTLNGTGDWAINQNWPDDYMPLGQVTNQTAANWSLEKTHIFLQNHRNPSGCMRFGRNLRFTLITHTTPFTMNAYTQRI